MVVIRGDSVTAPQRLLWLLKPTLFLACLAPLALLAWDAWSANLGANPITAIIARNGRWALRFLLITLAITPARRLSGWTWLIRYRRMLGLFAFTYACLHAASYLVLDQFFAWRMILEDVTKRPYITIGATAFTLLVPLAVTSTKKMIRRLGKRWLQLHRLIYVIGFLGVLHFLLLVKSDISSPAKYGAILLLLLGIRAWTWWGRAMMEWATGALAAARRGLLLRRRAGVAK